MRVMLDTNILISAGLFGGTRLAELTERIADDHNLVLSSQIIEELWMVVEQKFAHRRAAVHRLMSRLNFELAVTPTEIDLGTLPSIRDKKDYPVLASATNADVDVFITGDKDFFAVGIVRPQIMSLADFADKYL